jgi:hypothetical protein
MHIDVYHVSQKDMWDAFIQKSRNGTFLFLRDYMDYHKDRFIDHSLLVWNDNGGLIAVLPANLDGAFLVSHAGLTFGGFVIDNSMKTPIMLQVFEETLTYLKKKGLTKFIYKTVPYIYHRFPSEEDRYALFLCNARLIRRGLLTVVTNQERLPFQERRKRGIKKAKQNGLFVRQSDDFKSYWHILTDRLQKAHNAVPVHSQLEIEMLRSRFPENIKLFSCFQESTMLAGVLIYESGQVAHVQYIATNDLGLEFCAVDLIFEELMTGQYRSKPFFDFGTSDERNGHYLNRGLIDQKEGFGARAVACDHYEVSLDQWDVVCKLGTMRA